MNDSPFAFADLMAPIALEDFFSRTWERAPLHVKRSTPGFYDRLLTGQDVETAIASGGLRYPAIQLARGGAFFPADTFSRNIRSGDDVFSGVPDLDRIRAEYQAGATISLPGFHRAWQPLGALAAAVEGYFDHAVHTNVYVTPGAAEGFTPHYDTHDVFILQISGAKHWKIHAPPLALPHRSQPFSPQGYTPAAPVLEVDLTPGDLLYLPRGFVHATATAEAASIHVTLGITVYTWMELLAEWLASAKTDIRFRRALPPGFASREELQASLKDGFSQILAALREDLGHGQLIETFTRKVRAGLNGEAGAFQLDVKAIGPRSRLRTLERGSYMIASAPGGQIVLAFAAKALTLPGHLRATLDDMSGRSSFQGTDLKSTLGEDAKLALIRYLHKEGFLIADSRP